MSNTVSPQQLHQRFFIDPLTPIAQIKAAGPGWVIVQFAAIHLNVANDPKYVG